MRNDSGIEQGAASLLRKARLIGINAGRWSEQMIACRGIEGVRPLMGLLSLTNKHESDEVESACELG